MEFLFDGELFKLFHSFVNPAVYAVRIFEFNKALRLYRTERVTGIITDRLEGGNCGKAVLTTTIELRMLPSDSNLRSLRRLVLEQDVT